MYKVGDIVLITKECDGNEECIGKQGRIINVIENEDSHRTFYDIEFDFRFYGGHSGYFENGKNGHTWSFFEEHFTNTYVVELI